MPLHFPLAHTQVPYIITVVTHTELEERVGECSKIYGLRQVKYLALESM